MGAIILLVIIAASVAVIFMPQFQGLRTRIFTVLSAMWLAVVPLFGDLFQQLSTFAPALGDLGSFLKTDMNWRMLAPDAWEPIFLLAVMVCFWVLRNLTTGPVGKV